MINALSFNTVTKTATGIARASTDMQAGPAAAVSGAGNTDFASVFASVAAEAVGSVRAGEQAAISGIQGKVPVQQVVEAVMSAEQTLQTAIAMRDKVVAAYQEISRMAI